MTDTEDAMVDVAGAKLHARVEGAASGDWVVFVHSLGTSLELWDGQIDAIGAGYRTLRYSMRGHGRSDAPPGPYDIGLLADDFFALIDHYGIMRAHVVGISLGGLTALEVALRGRPEIASIAFCNSRADMPAEFAAGIDERNRLVRTEGMGVIADAMVERWLTPRTIATRPKIADAIRRIVTETPVEGFAGCSEGIKSSGLIDRMDSIRLPALFVAADQDGGLPVEVIRGMQQKVEGSRFACIPGAGHLSNLDQPAVYNAILLSFLEGVGP